jgi:dihydrofolate reductase
MRKVIYGLSVSLDGYVEDAQGGLGWSYPDEELHRHFNDRERDFDVNLYGRRLYELMAAYWPTAEEDPALLDYEREYARIWKSKPKVVFSRTLDHVEWNSRLVRDHIAEEVNRLKNQPGKYMNVGGPGIVATFMQLGLIDEYWLYVVPVVLGGGKPMFPPLTDRLQLQLVETRKFSRGVVLLRYQPASAG